MTPREYNVLFLCTANSARSIIAEGILNHIGGPFRAHSAGSTPRGQVHPMALSILESFDIDTGFARSKSWDEFASPDAPKLDFVFTVCDKAASETCPFWPGQPMTAHWGVPDPAAVIGDAHEIKTAFAATYRALRNRITLFTSLPISSIDSLALQGRLEEIGRTEND